MANVLRCSRSCQRLIIRCMLAAALITAIVCFGTTWPPAANADILKDDHLLWRRADSPQERLVEDNAVKHAITSQESASSQVQVEAVPSARHQPEKLTASVSDSQWTESVHHIETLLDDEYRMKSLLAPISETGEPLLRDLTHRVRAFRDVFQSWEKLHVDSKDGMSRRCRYGNRFYRPLLTRSR